MMVLQSILAAGTLAALLSNPATSEAATPSQRFNWRSELNTVTRFLSTTGKLNQENCASTIGSFASRLESLPSDAFAPRDADEAEAVIAGAPRAFDKLFRVRILLKKQLDGFTSPSKACVDAVRRGLRVARFAEDYLADWLHAQGRDPQQSDRLFDGDAAQVAINPSFGSVELRTGDLLLMRGPRIISALIARSGDEEGDFSHLAIIGEDTFGRKYVVEALVENGVITTPLEDYLENKEEGHVVLLRYRNAGVALRAGREIYSRAQAAIDAGSRIRYNFSLDRRDNTRLFCAQVIEYAYQSATGGRVDLPKYPSTLSKLKQTPIYSALGIKVQQTFSPSDIQLDPRVAIVAEYRNAKYVRQMRHDNVVLTKLLEWMRRGYSIRPAPFEDFLAGVVLHLISGGDISEEAGLPNRQGVAILISLGRVATALGDTVAGLDARAEAEGGHTLTFRELTQQLEDVRLQECGLEAHSTVVQRLLVAPRGACGLVAR